MLNKSKYSIEAKVKRKFWSGKYYTVYSLIEETEGKQYCNSSCYFDYFPVYKVVAKSSDKEMICNLKSELELCNDS